MMTMDNSDLDRETCMETKADSESVSPDLIRGVFFPFHALRKEEEEEKYTLCTQTPIFIHPSFYT